MRTIRTGSLVVIALLGACGKHCEEVPGDVSAAERTWVPYTAGASVAFVKANGDSGTLTAGAIESRWHNGGGSKGECSKDYESLHRPLSGIDLPNGAELAVIHSRETGNAPGYVCGYYMDMAPVNDVIINGTSYDNVYITFDSAFFFTKADGLLKAGEWMKVP